MVYKRGAEFLYKRRLEYEKRDGKRGAVELLGKGQYYNVAGPHPKGGYYGWRHGQSPVEWGPDRLSEITPEDADQYFADLQKFLGERGCKIIESSSSSGGGARLKLDDKRLHAPSLSHFLAAMRAIDITKFHSYAKRSSC